MFIIQEDLLLKIEIFLKLKENQGLKLKLPGVNREAKTSKMVNIYFEKPTI